MRTLSEVKLAQKSATLFLNSALKNLYSYRRKVYRLLVAGMINSTFNIETQPIGLYSQLYFIAFILCALHLSR